MVASAFAYAYLLLSTALLVVWLVLYAARADLRRQLLRLSLATMGLGLTEPFRSGVLESTTLFDLAWRTGFDLESLVFSFAIGGIVFVAYDACVGTAPDALNPIYAAALGLVAGSVATLVCRRDLRSKMLVSDVLFLVLYFVVFAVFNVAFPGYVAAVWRLSALTGIRLVGVPLEELMFAFTFGLYWSTV